VEHEAYGKDGIERSVLDGKVLAVTLDERERGPASARVADLGPGSSHHLKRDIDADELQLSLQEPREESSCSTRQIKTAADGCAEGGSHVEGTLDCCKHEAVSFLTFRRQEA
jgi:hypothetical protein